MIDDDFCFAILCPNGNTGSLKNTIGSIKIFFNNPIYGVAPDVCDLKSLRQIIPVKQAGSTITSLVDVAIAEASRNWVFVVFSGTWVDPGPIRKYLYFTKDKKDILYQVSNHKWLFHESSMNGLFVHRDSIREIGDFGNDFNNLAEAKLYWGAKAIEKGYKLKGIVGAKLI